MWLRIEFRSDHNHRRFHTAPTNFVRASNKIYFEPTVIDGALLLEPVEDKSLITYGNAPCPRCKSQGGHPVQESEITRNAASEIYYYMYEDRGLKKALKGFMLGVAHQKETKKLCVAMSTNNDSLIKSLMDPKLLRLPVGQSIFITVIP